jgi:MFS family permease
VATDGHDDGQRRPAGADDRPSATDTVSTFASLAYPVNRLLFLSALSVVLATNVQLIARGWLARDLSGSNAGLGGVFLGFGLPLLIATPFAGVASDRFSKRAVLLVGQLLLLVSTSGIAVALALDLTRYWMLVVAAGLQAVGFALFTPARAAFTAEAVPYEMLPNALALNQMSQSVCQVIGPAVAGVMISSALGVEGAYYVIAALTFGGLIATAPLPPGRPAPDRPQDSVLHELADGVNYVRGSHALRYVVVVSLVVIVSGFPYVVLFPGVAEELFDRGASGYAILTLSGALGASVTSVFVARRGAGERGWKIQTLAGAAFGAGLLLVAVAPNFAAATLAAAVVGGGAAAFNTMSNTLALTNSSLEFHGRVQSLMFISFSGFGLVALPIGALADSIGLRQTLAGMGALIVVTITIYDRRRRRHLSAASRILPL